MKVDTQQLAGVISLCFDYSMDGRFSPALQGDFLALGKRLRGSLLNLLSAQFNEGTQAVIDANRDIQQQNQQLSNAAQTLNNATNVLNSLTQLVGVLDGLLKLAAGFV